MLAACVITTINPPTKAVRKLVRRFPGQVVVVGDRKTPADWACDGALFIPVDAVQDLTYRDLAPVNHYARKNLGYLHAIRARAPFIYDTDDDNAPNAAWAEREEQCRVAAVHHRGWCNVYRYFHASNIWPRGLPLDHVRDAAPALTKALTDVRAPVQQGLADGDPDVDAVWRLVLGHPIKFIAQRSVALAPGAWCPFNSQTTWWWPQAYPLMYLPTHVTFRMTDIWRSFVAQRCLWEHGRSVVFHSPSEVVQDRNAHDLMHDFKDEVPGYLHNRTIAEVLGALTLQRGPHVTATNLLLCYVALVTAGIVPEAELPLVRAWVADVERFSPP